MLITDGEGHDSGAIEAAERAAEQGIRIFTIGIGTPEGAPIQIGGEFIKDDKGEMVVSKLGEPLLEKIAQATDGAYIRSTNQSIGLDEIVRTINNMEKGDLAALRFEEFNEQFQYLIGAALVLLLLEFLLLDRRNPLLRRFNIFGTDTENKNSDSPLTPNRRAFCRFRRLGVRETTGRITPRSDGSALSPND